MKKIILLALLLIVSNTFSQVNENKLSKKNELKGNALFLVLGAFEITYERLINENSGIGVSLFMVNEEDFDASFSLTPYYRAYFGKKTAAGFFVEGFSMINTGKSDSYYNYNYNTDTNYYVEGEKYLDFALGFGVGSKWIHSRGFTFEINGGIGRNLFSNTSPEIVGRGGITLGYRF